ncbi:hypothetical protein [Bdellovibrio svalbardensis]|uniref:Uncharacterized protein n=1 Tax=Bdellovibrio svalbardensis TaxID=2972972 RepID=A0ABT6DIP6_9BACT|nr:hypothetical protein [Bdellovibrio svalbardensis]MDG0816728.1 hypothetical protein [Bdellovibrio svalbardensis]
MNEYEKVIEKILNHFVGEAFKDELATAKSEFFANAGTLDENSEHFESRMAQFYDWYFFTRELLGYKQTPLEACHLVRELRFSEEELNIIEILKKHRHSLFEFIKIKNGDVYIKDLLANKKLVVKASPFVFGFDPDEVFEVRLIPVGDSFIFTRGFCFHPESAKKFILSEVKRHRKDPDLDPDVMMLRLIKMRYKFEQYKHVRPEMIYSNEGKLGI